MNITITLTGTTPLLMHNPRLVDPEFDITRQIKELTSKRKKTDADLKQIGRLEWFGGIYEENGRVVQPTSKVRKCLVNTARMSKLGKAVERALSFRTLYAPLIHDGPQKIEQLFTQSRYHSRLSVGVGTSRVMRVRPQFPVWELSVSGLFVEDAGLNVDEFERIVELAGVVEGLGDNRVNGYGRFTAKIEKA
jgi:hypothetical protein